MCPPPLPPLPCLPQTVPERTILSSLSVCLLSAFSCRVCASIPLYQSICCMPILAEFVRVFLSISLSVVCLLLQNLCEYSSLSVYLLYAYSCRICASIPLYQSICCMPPLAEFVRVFLSISLSVVCLFLQNLCEYSSLSVCLLSAYSCRVCASIPLYQSICCMPILAGFVRVFLSISLSVVCLFLHNLCEYSSLSVCLLSAYSCSVCASIPLYQSICCMPILAGFVRVFLSISLSVICLFLQGLCEYSSLSVCLLYAYSCRVCAGIPLYQSVCCLPILVGFVRVFLSISLSVVCLFLQGLCGYSSLSVYLLSAYSCRVCAGIALYQSVCCLPILAEFVRVFLSISLSVVCLCLHTVGRGQMSSTFAVNTLSDLHHEQVRKKLAACPI